MAIEEDSAIMLIGFAIVLVVGLNIILFFGDVTSLGGNAVTGAAVVDCKDVADGIACGDSTFILASGGICSYGTTKVCTNNCELARIYANDGRVCSTTCIDICVPAEIAKKL